MNIRKEEITLAYMKLKSYAYYDNSSIVLRKQIAEFEDDDIEENLQNIYEEIKKDNFDKYINKINVIYAPKKIEKEDYDDEKVSNIICKNVILTEVTSIIECPILLQLLGIVWIIRTSDFFEKNLSESVYANRIRNVNDSTISLFEPYYNKYSEWRDNAIEAIEKRLNDEKSIVYLTMDIKNYYYSIDMSSEIGFKKLKNELQNYYQDSEIIIKITEIIEKICKRYSSRVIKERRCILPIGFLPSSLLANWYLKEFDRNVLESINPLYYGRYVDDIIIVCNIYDTDKKKSEIIKKYLVNTGILKENKSKGVNCYEICGMYKNLIINDKKLDVKIIDFNYSSAEIEIFKKQIDKNRSEFKILPEDIEQCIGEIYKINYCGSKNKIGSLAGVEIDKLELSKSLSKVIFKGKQDIYHNNSSDYFNKELLFIFKYQNAIENFRLWEKVILYLNQSKNFAILKNFIENLRIAINYIHVNITNDLNYSLKIRENNLEEKIKDFLNTNLIIAISMSGALNREYNKAIIYCNKDLENRIDNFTDKLLVSNMMRHNYVAIPLINYCNFNGEIDLVSYDVNNIISKELNQQKLKYSPRFIHLHEFTLYFYYQSLNNKKYKDEYLNYARNEFVKVNYSNKAIVDDSKYFNTKF